VEILPNPYYQPKDLGLEIVAEFEADISYEFEMVVVWKDEKGKLYWATDSGCSCPEPYEDYDTIEDLFPLTLTNFGDFEAAVAGMYETNEVDQKQFIQDVKMLLKGKR
jgi:hypothetical protein